MKEYFMAERFCIEEKVPGHQFPIGLKLISSTVPE
jgi:hypothetical protein